MAETAPFITVAEVPPPGTVSGDDGEVERPSTQTSRARCAELSRELQTLCATAAAELAQRSGSVRWAQSPQQYPLGPDCEPDGGQSGPQATVGWFKRSLPATKPAARTYSRLGGKM